MTDAADAIDATAVVLNFDAINKRVAELGITRGELAADIGVDPATIWRWERRGVKPAFDVIVRLARTLDLEIGDVTCQGSPTPRPAPSPASPRPAPAPATPSKPKAER